jgi:Chaperone of endosialidase
MAGSNNTAIGSNASFGIVNNANYATAIGAGAVANGDDLLVLGKFAGNYDGVARPADRVFVRGTLTVFSLADGTSTTMCRSANTLSFCSSSIRYKENINSFSPGLSLVKQLRPVSFTWKSNGSLDFGLVAEEVAKVEPLLITRNDKGDIEGVKYERVGVVLLNAVNEQQQQIDSQQRKIEAQQKQLQQQSQTIRGQQAKLDAMKKFICSKNPKAELCRPKD